MDTVAPNIRLSRATGECVFSPRAGAGATTARYLFPRNPHSLLDLYGLFSSSEEAEDGELRSPRLMMTRSACSKMKRVALA